MSFFNLTHTGVQDPFKTASYIKEDHSTTATTEGDTDRSQNQSLQNQTDNKPQSSPSSLPLPPSSSTSPLNPTHVQTMYSSSETGESGRTWHRGSHCLYTEQLRKHRRHPQGPMELYQHPLTTSNEYGWWMKDSSPHREQWAQTERHAHVNSEMTRFVDDMSLTNKEFSLY